MAVIGASALAVVRGIDPETGFYFDDTKRYVDAVSCLTDMDKKKIYEDNTRRVFPRLDARLSKSGK